MERNRLKSRSAFTILELIIVVIIVGILTSLAIPRLFKSIKRARAAEAIGKLRTIHEAFQRCLLMNNFDFFSLSGENVA